MLKCIYLLLFFALNLNSAETEINIYELASNSVISCRRELKYCKVIGYFEGKQIKQEAIGSVSFQITKNDNTYDYCLTMPQLSATSFSEEKRQEFVICLHEAFQNPKTMEHYMAGGALKETAALNKANANANLHARNLANDPTPRFIICAGNKIIGFVRVGGTENPWENENLTEAWKDLGYKKEESGWIDPDGQPIGGFGEFAILLSEEFTNLGFGRIIVKAVMEFVMPICRKIGVTYENKLISHVIATVSPENVRSQKVLKECFLAVKESAAPSHYNVNKLFYVRKIGDDLLDGDGVPIEVSQE
jgi:hypothetical protein